ncbi:hypothetical protein [Streptomyces sp. NBC_00197]|uniref:hypothetical protein n=1 Tax=Streptomyces sp. NBC_00197 TaxID=2975676 RepID=UPI00324AB55C
MEQRDPGFLRLRYTRGRAAGGELLAGRCPPGHDADVFLPPPNPAHRLRYTLDPQDQRRLALHAALTAAGIPPMPEDRAAIDQISALPPAVNTVLQRWLHHAL